MSEKWRPEVGMTLSNAFSFARNKISESSWNEFARLALDLGDDIDEIISDHAKRGEQKHNMLKKWELLNGPNATVESLYDCINRFLKLGKSQETGTQSSASYKEYHGAGGDHAAYGSRGTRGDPGVRGGYGANDCQRFKKSEESQSDARGASPHGFATKVFSEGLIEATSTKLQSSERQSSVLDDYSYEEEKRPTTATDTFPFNKNKKSKSKPDASPSQDSRPPRPKFNFCEKFVPLIPPASQDFYDKHPTDASIYPITGDPKGCVLILNNNFSGTPREREGSSVDVINMETLWKGLGCELYGGKVHEDLTAEDMRASILDMSRLEQGKYSFIAIVIMTHGGVQGGEEKSIPDVKGFPAKVKLHSQEVFYGNDNTPVPIQEVLEWFSNVNATNLQNIPKLFFLQFCRGRSTDKGTVTADAYPHDGGDSEKAGIRIPTISDILVAYPTHLGNTALRNTEYGSWYINAITNVFMRHAGQEHVVDMLTRVNDSMASMTDLMVDRKSFTFECKAMSNFQSSLRRKLYLFPGFPKSNEK